MDTPIEMWPTAIIAVCAIAALLILAVFGSRAPAPPTTPKDANLEDALDKMEQDTRRTGTGTGSKS